MTEMTRRMIVLGGPALLAGCASSLSLTGGGYDPSAIYAAQTGEEFPVPAIPYQEIDPQFYRRIVSHPSRERPGTIIVDPHRHFLYHLLGHGKAVRYGVGVGREGFAWSGTDHIERKAKWPRWTPPKEMQIRDRRAAQYAHGMAPGLDNPLGARAMYLYEGGHDTEYRIHGTNEPLSIGKSMSSGCIRLLNQDVIDLYSRTPIGTKVVVLPA